MIEDNNQEQQNEESIYIKNKGKIKTITAIFVMSVFLLAGNVILKRTKEIKKEITYVTLSSIDWIDTTDTCQGTRKSSVNSSVYYFKAKDNKVNLSLPILKGYRWATTKEYKDLMVNNRYRVYYEQCGYNGFPLSHNGEKQKNFYFSDSYKTGKSTNAFSIEGKIESIRKENMDSFAGYVLIKQ